MHKPLVLIHMYTNAYIFIFLPSKTLTVYD